MSNYQKMYSVLFNAAIDAIVSLQKAQQETEELYLSEEEPQSTAEANDEVKY